ncbi:MAG: hypothetical protein Fur0039_23680 [Rhodocyclaceae bacterium]
MKRAVSFFTALIWAGALWAADPAVVQQKVKGQFDEVKENVVHAIEAHGLVIDYTANVGAMLERTGKDLGATKKIYEQAQVLEFCSAKASREMAEADPRNLVYCPYSIAVYSLAKEPGVVYVAYRKPGNAPGMAGVGKLLAAIVTEAKR